jgi:putative N6-adenine-specific DNA methylase
MNDKFYLVINPGLVASSRAELMFWYPDLKVKDAGPGGLEFETPLADGLQMNLILKTPTRILLRLADFGCRDFPKLFKKMKGFDWSPWLKPHDSLCVEASSHSSWLKIKKRIEETVLAGVQAAGYAKAGLSPEAPATLYVRFEQNVCYLSLDTSGEILHKRGYRIETPEAPLRENLASALLWALAGAGAKDGSKDDSSQFNQEPTLLVDPMAGSGTFLIEALRLTEISGLRSFAFQQFPVVLQLAEPQSQLLGRAPFFTQALGFEADASTVQLARKAAHLAQAASFTMEEQDIFKAQPLSEVERKNKKLWLICNPPYGRRLKVQEPLSLYYSRLWASCESTFTPDRAGFLLPQNLQGSNEPLKIPPAWKKEQVIQFSNGGINVQFYIFHRALR